MFRLCEFQLCYNNLAHFSPPRTEKPADTKRLADTFQVFRQEFKGLYSKNIFKFGTINSAFCM
jgi:hypothetical protein